MADIVRHQTTILGELSNQNETGISVYQAGKVDDTAMMQGFKALKEAFAGITPDWIRIVKRIIQVEQWNNQRFLDAVKVMVKNHKYPNPTPAVFLDYNKFIDEVTYKQMCDYKLFDTHGAYNVGGELKWIKKSDAEKYGFEKWKPKPKEKQKPSKTINDLTNKFKV